MHAGGNALRRTEALATFHALRYLQAEDEEDAANEYQAFEYAIGQLPYNAKAWALMRIVQRVDRAVLRSSRGHRNRVKQETRRLERELRGWGSLPPM